MRRKADLLTSFTEAVFNASTLRFYTVLASWITYGVKQAGTSA
jgi:hypothetical protein